MNKHNLISVYLWGDYVGALYWDEQTNTGNFEYDPFFIKKGTEVSPLFMPLKPVGFNNTSKVYTFPEHQRSSTFKGLPGLLSDSLPDSFGSAILRAWLASRKLDTANLNPAVLLSYVGNRGMGALEFKPAEHSRLLNRSVEISLDAIADLCATILDHRKSLDVSFSENDNLANQEAINDIIRIGTSPGGANPKAIIAMNEDGRVLSGQVEAPAGFKHYMIKFDLDNNDSHKLVRGLASVSGSLEYAYYLMAAQANIKMCPSRTIQASGRVHFLTERFDRNGNQKIHTQTLAAMGHLDRDNPHDYAQLAAICRTLHLGKESTKEIYRRMLFNALSLNHDDHTKNHGFMMDSKGEWSLTPAYDITFSVNSESKWTNRHQMSIYGKHDNFTQQDFMNAAEAFDLTGQQAQTIVDEVRAAIANWQQIAYQAGIDLKTRDIIARKLREQEQSVFKGHQVSDVGTEREYR